MNISEKAAYLKGLADGLSYDKESAEGKLLTALIDLCGELATAIDEIDSDLEELNDYIEEVDEDLGDVEAFLCDIDEDEDDWDEDDECSDCAGCEGCAGVDEDDFRMMMCPACNEEIYFDESMDPADLICPACGKSVCEDDVEDLD